MKQLLLSFILFASVAVSAQSNISPEQAIKEIKSGVLIVNLIYPEMKIDALLKSGKKEESLALTEEVKQSHQRLINAFSREYTFGKVLFIYSNNMGALADGDATVLFSASGNAQSSLPASYYFVELNETQRMSANGLIVKDNMRDPLGKPFPYFVSQYTFFNLKSKSETKMVMELNKKFSRFYDRVNLP